MGVRQICVLIGAVFVSACGAEVAGTAATAAALQAGHAQQAKNQQRELESKLAESLKLGADRASAAGQ
jgi:Kef-type K+ transport system membrane component KefB